MALRIRKPILVGGISLSVMLWLWESYSQSIIQAGELGIFGLSALGAGLWWWQHQATPQLKPVELPNRKAVEEAIAQIEVILTCLEIEAANQDISELRQRVAQLPKALERKTLQLAIAGSKQSGKTTLKQLLETAFAEICIAKTEACLTGEKAEQTATELALASDWVLFLTTGDLTESEWQILQRFKAAQLKTFLVFNQQDRYSSDERAVILQQLRQRVQPLIPQEDVIAIAAAPDSVKVRQHQADGSTQEWLEKSPVQIEDLCARLTSILTAEKPTLVYATTWRQAMNLKQHAKAKLNEVRRDCALPIIEQYQWFAAAAAFANPVATLDLLATAAIGTQLLVDLSGIYQQPFSLSQAQRASAEFGKLMVKLGLVELSTQAIGSILKSNAFTYVAGGAIQGVSAAYLTRIAGLSLIEYFQEQEVSATADGRLNLEKLGQKLQQVFQQQRRLALQNFVKQTVARLAKVPQSQPVS